MGLTNTQYDALMRMYSQRQLEARHEQEKRREEAYAAIPALEDLDREAGAASLARARVLLGGDGSAPAGGNAVISAEGLRSALADISARRARLLEAHGFPADYLEPRYTCPDCRDTGYVDGKRCRCFIRAATELLYDNTGLREVLARENFDTFSLDYYPEDLVHPQTGKSAKAYMQEVRALCLRFVRDFDLPPEKRAVTNLFFYGGCGLGKTFLSHCIARELIETSHSVLCFSAGDLFDGLARETFRREDTSAGAAVSMEDLTACDLLILDDLGTEMTNTFVASALFRILSGRLSAARSTIISTNLPLQVFADTYSERVFSRITSSFRLIQLYGNDIRIQKKLKGIP